MKPRLLFHKGGYVILTGRSRVPWLWLTLLLALAALFGLYALAESLDRAAEQRLGPEPQPGQTELQRAFDAGVSQGHADMVASATAAWQAAGAEADVAAAKCKQQVRP